MALGLARLLGTQGFGVFPAMNAVAVLAAAVAVLGQNATILRAADAPDPRGPLRDAAGTVGVATLVVFGPLLAAGGALGLTDHRPAAVVALGAAALTFALAWAEIGIAAVQAQSRLWLAIAPRELIWRGASGVGGLLLAGRIAPGPLASAVAAAVLLFLCVAAQVARAGLPGGRLVLRPRWRPVRAGFGRAAGALSGLALASLSVVVIAAVMGPSTAGAFFVAQRIAQIAGLPLIAANSARARDIAVAHASGDAERLGRVLARDRLTTIAATVLLGSAAFAGAGPLLSLWGAEAAAMRDPLAILICGAMINALCGPTGQVMTLCRGHRALLGQTLVVQGAALALPPAIAWEGARGAALASPLAVLAGNLVAVTGIRRRLGVDPGIGG